MTTTIGGDRRPERTLDPTDTPHVYYEEATGKYLWSDETGDIENGEYDTLIEARAALRHYCDTMLQSREP